MTEEVRWMPAGPEASHDASYRDTDERELRAMVKAAAAEHATAWKRGLGKADEEGKAAVTLAGKTLAKGKLPAELTIDDAARLLSLLGASTGNHVRPLGELVIRAHGLAFAIAVCARMWSHKSDAVRGGGISIRAIDDDDDHVHDASCSYAKADFTRYLASRYHASTAKERTDMKRGVTRIWETTTPHARPALAWATQDPDRAKQSALELIDAGESPWPYFAWDHLPYLITDTALALRILGDRHLSVELIENLGVAVWPLYAERLAGHMDSHSRARMLAEFANFYGPATALIIAEYEDTKQCAPIVRDYFTRYPELLARIIDEPALKYHRDDLLKLTAGTPHPDHPRS